MERAAEFSAKRSIAADHPSLAGHFPNRPIVPGVVLLDEVFKAVRGWRDDCRVSGVSSAKFLRPLQPEQVFTIRLSARNTQHIHFECVYQEQPLAQGFLDIAPL